VAALVRVVPVMTGSDRLHALGEVGDRILRAEELGNGRLTAPERSLAVDWLAAVSTMGSRDLLFPCVQIARRSTDADLVEAAREAAKALSGSAG
jgi:hypothetical protein